jgi:hypothetical protein
MIRIQIYTIYKYNKILFFYKYNFYKIIKFFEYIFLLNFFIKCSINMHIFIIK